MMKSNFLSRPQNGESAGVLVSPTYQLAYENSFSDSICKGISDAESGRTYHAEEIRTALKARRSKE